MRFPFAALLTLLAYLASGQDYVVTTRKDTLRGGLEILSFPTMDKVQVVVEKKKSEFSAFKLLMVSIDGQTYLPVLLTDGYRILKLSRPGNVSLCMARQSAGMPYNIPYLVKRTGQALEIPTLLFKKQVSEFLGDCNEIKEKISTEDLGKKDVDKIIDFYNQCIENQTLNKYAFSLDPRLVALTELRKKLELDQTIPKDALDILNDIYQKVKDNNPVPNYLTEGFRDVLKDHQEYQSDIDNLLAKLKG